MSEPAKDLQVGIIGAGTMGAGIAQVAADNGHPVLFYDVDDRAVTSSPTPIIRTATVTATIYYAGVPLPKCDLEFANGERSID